MDKFLGFFRRILGSQDERHEEDHNVRNRNPVYKNIPVNTTPPDFPRSPVTQSAPFYQPNDGDSPTFSNRPLHSSYKPPQSVSKLSPSSSSLKDPTYSSKSSASSSNLPPSSFSPSSKSSVSSPNTPKPPPDSSPTYYKPPQSSPSLSPSSSKPLPSSQKPVSSHKPSLSSPEGLPSSSGKGTPPIYAIPEDIKGLIKKDIVPAVLKQPLSPSTYKRYFAALLYAEDFYLEKWRNFQLKNVVLELPEAEIKKRPNKYKYRNRSVKKDDKIFVEFEYASIPEKLPFLLSRDLVYARPLGKKVKPFQGSISHVVKSTRVFVEFGDDFHSQHCSTSKYDINFSLNKVCLERAHQAIEAASNPLFQNFLFPECISRKNILNPPTQFLAYQGLGIDEFAAVHHILHICGSPPYLLGGSLSEINQRPNMLVVFEFDSIPEKLPFLLSRDLVYAQPSGKKVRPFQGSFCRVVKNTHVLVEFGEHFHSQHCSTSKYDINFSLNKVCLKRAHQAIEATSNALLQNFLFPKCSSRENILNLPFHFPANQEFDEFAAVHHILSFRGSPPYLVGGSRSTITKADNTSLSRTGLVVRDAVFEAYKISPEHRILVCAPTNSTCDVLNKSLKMMISEADMFRANAALREIDGVPIDILSSCPLEGERFACPPLQQLLRFKIILTTFVSSFRLHNEGVVTGHFTHIFLVDASSTTEPEVMVALANFANDNTTVIVTGAPGDHSSWVRSDVGRKYGLRKSYFARLHELEPYRSRNSMFITNLDAFDQ